VVLVYLLSCLSMDGIELTVEVSKTKLANTFLIF